MKRPATRPSPLSAADSAAIKVFAENSLDAAQPVEDADVAEAWRSVFEPQRRRLKLLSKAEKSSLEKAAAAELRAAHAAMGAPVLELETTAAAAPAEVELSPVATLFPAMTTAAFEALCVDIEQHGLREPIVLDRAGRLIDGRHRLAACTAAGVPPRFTTLDGDDQAVLAFALSANLRRRQMDESRRAMLAADLGDLSDFQVLREQAIERVRAGAARGRAAQAGERTSALARAARPGGKVVAQLAAMVDVSPRYVEMARSLKARGDAELEAKVRAGELPLTAAHREIRADDERAEIAAYVPPPGRFAVLVVDPPWRYDVRNEDETHRGRTPYETMSIDEIAALDVGAMAEPDSIMFLWTTASHARHAYRLLDAWGFEEKTVWCWIKVDGKGDLRMGPGSWGRNAAEFVVVAVRGRPKIDREVADSLPTVFLAQRTERHSEKPAEFYARVEKLCPYRAEARLDLFARAERPGWTCSGAEVPDAR